MGGYCFITNFITKVIPSLLFNGKLHANMRIIFIRFANLFGN
ncbi:hypothetical protein SAMN05216436_12236 [bacterium A37T11]|nr:hypothetical protein SAMN05216436_12236 [bacterium A37T11]